MTDVCALSIRVSCVLLAAGESRRFGTNKLLLPFRGTNVISCALNVYDRPEIAERVVVTGNHTDDVMAGVNDPYVKWVINPHPEMETGSSLRIGLQNVSEDFHAVIIAHGDMPLVRRETVSAMLRMFQRDSIVIPRHQNRKGHPVLLDRRIADKCLDPIPEIPLRHVIRLHESKIIYLDTDDEGVLTDIDTWEDYNRIINQP